MNQPVVSCPQCKKKFRISAEFVDKRFECNQCGHRFKITAKPRTSSSPAEKPRRSPPDKSRPAPSGGSRPTTTGKSRPAPKPAPKPTPTPRRAAQPRPAPKPAPSPPQPRVDLTSAAPQGDLFDELYSVGPAAQPVTAPVPPLPRQMPTNTMRRGLSRSSPSTGMVWQIVSRLFGVAIIIPALLLAIAGISYVTDRDFIIESSRHVQAQLAMNPSLSAEEREDALKQFQLGQSILFIVVISSIALHWIFVGGIVAARGILYDRPSWPQRGVGCLWLLGLVLSHIIHDMSREAIEPLGDLLRLKG